MKTFLSKLLSEKGEKSSMRLAFLIVTALTSCLLIAFMYVIIIQAKTEHFNGFELAALLTAIYTGYSGAAYMKKEQKKMEKQNENQS